MERNLYNIDENCDYVFTDADDGSEMVFSGKELNEKGFALALKDKHSSKIYFYKEK